MVVLFFCIDRIRIESLTMPAFEPATDLTDKIDWCCAWVFRRESLTQKLLSGFRWRTTGCLNFRPGSTVILFDLGLGESELEELLHFCNGSMNESQLRIKSNLTSGGLKHSSAVPSLSRWESQLRAQVSGLCCEG